MFSPLDYPLLSCLQLIMERLTLPGVSPRRALQSPQTLCCCTGTARHPLWHAGSPLPCLLCVRLSASVSSSIIKLAQPGERAWAGHTGPKRFLQGPPAMLFHCEPNTREVVRMMSCLCSSLWCSALSLTLPANYSVCCKGGRVLALADYSGRENKRSKCLLPALQP